MLVPEQAVSWLRAVDPARVDDPVAAACTLGLLAHRTPAWTERYDELLGALAASSPPPAALVAAGVRALVGEGRGSRRSAAPPTWPDDPPHDVVDGLTLGLGVLLHDRAYGTDHHAAWFDRWWVGAAPRMRDDQLAEALLLLAPQRPDEARATFEASPRLGAPARLLALDWGLPDLPADDDGAWSVAAELGTAGGWSALFGGPLPWCPRIVGVDASQLVLRRAEWWRECLLLTLAPAQADRGATTEFRLVGAEPRIWCQTGIDGARTDATGHGMVVRSPLVAGDLEFTPGSY